jgi:hypothetical protein
VRGITGLLQRTLGPGVVMRSHFSRDLPAAHTDANQLETALLNLAVNARDAMPDGGAIDIEGAVVTVAADSRMGCRAALCPPQRHRPGRRHGCRHPRPRHRALLHHQGRRQGHRPGPVDGAWLAEQSGGRLVLSSEPGHGTRVELWLPEAHAVGQPRAAQARIGDEAATDRSSCSRSTTTTWCAEHPGHAGGPRPRRRHRRLGGAGHGGFA